MKKIRHVILVLFFAGLAALEIGHGISRLSSVRERSRGELLGTIERGHTDLAARLRSLLEAQKDHARNLSRMPPLQALLEGPALSGKQGLERFLFPYMLSFRTIDRIRVLDMEGREVVHCVRHTRGVGAMPTTRLRAEPDGAILALGAGLATDAVGHTSLVVDEDRVENAESERQVIHYVVGVDRPGGSGAPERLGFLVLTVYAAPVLSAVREFVPVNGVTPFLVEGDGLYLAHVDRDRELRGHVTDDLPLVSGIVAGALDIVVDPEFVVLSRTISDDPVWRFMILVPEAALGAAAGDFKGEYVWIIGSVVVIFAVLAIAAIFFVRLSLREVQLEEARRQQELERQLQVQERLGALGMLTAGVAHEINNPLEGIGNYLSLLEREGIAPEKRARYLGLVRHGFHRIRDIVRDLSEFSRRDAGDGVVDLRSILDKALKLSAYDPRAKTMDVEIRGLGEPLEVPGDAGRLEQVCLNLALNAGRAMAGEGRLSVEVLRGDPVRVLFEDDGPGIPEEDLDKIFDPFYTTTGGTGLGLAISHTIVVAHGGTLRAENRESGGARFILTLPAPGAIVEERP